MIRFLSVLFATVLFSTSVVSVAGDCNKTVMGGGCTIDADAGVAPHMRSQPKPVVTKAKAVETTVKEAAVAKNVKVSQASK